MSFPKFSEWMSVREEVVAPTAGAKAPVAGMPGIKKPEDPKFAQAVVANLKKNKGKVKPEEIIDAVYKSGAGVKDVIKVAKDVGEDS